MNNEDKQLLLKDLCGRLPNEVKISQVIEDYISEPTTITNINPNGTIIVDYEPFQDGTPDIDAWCIENVKPYLRPLSSMTEEEKELLRQEHLKDEKLYIEAINGDGSMRGKVITHYAADWCNKHHFDYRGLIEKGLALPSPEGMYKN